jgi:hypothetical protein
LRSRKDVARRAGTAASDAASDAYAALAEFVREIEATMQRALAALEDVAGAFSNSEKLAIVTVPFGPARFFYNVIAASRTTRSRRFGR